LIQERPESRGNVEIFLFLSLRRPHFKNDSDHVRLCGYSIAGAMSWSVASIKTSSATPSLGMGILFDEPAFRMQPD
jgi:hypothetical protein